MKDVFDPAVYFLASHRNGTLYVGVTSNLLKRVHEHREGLLAGFTKDYGVGRLVWFEQHATMEHAITREKRIKKWNRAWKIALIEEKNADWRDLAVELGFDPLPSRRIA
jgi:putative endonuclease